MGLGDTVLADPSGGFQHFFHRALAHQQVVAAGIGEDDRQAPPDEVER